MGKDPCAAFGCNLEKGDHYYIQTRYKDLFSHYNLILRKL